MLVLSLCSHIYVLTIADSIILSQTSMENLQPHMTFSCFSILFLLHSSSLFFPSTSDSTPYTLPDKYFINCGSSSSLSVYGRNFTGDENPSYFVLSSGDSKLAENLTVTAEKLYQSARIFRKSSSYKLDLDENGTYMVRFHFFPLPSLGNLSNARFNVFASGFSLLSNFTVENKNYPLIQEFLLEVPQGNFKIDFVPYTDQSFAFVNAIEVILAPLDFIPDSARHVGTSKENYDVLNGPLHLIHRINVGGENVTPNNDTMLRYWVPDDDYLFFNYAATNSQVYTDRPKYQSGGATKYDAPDPVYRTAKQMNIVGDDKDLTNFNVSWHFDVRKGVEHLVRLHFCDIVSRTSNEFFKFNLYIYSNFRLEMYPYDVIPELASPFYRDFLVYSDESGFMNISVGPSSNSPLRQAFLNGVEIMELIRVRGLDPKGSVVIIVGSCVGGVIVVLIMLIVLLIYLRRRKWKPVEAFDWPLAPINGGSSYSRTTVRTSIASPLADLNLGLKLSFSEILFSTKQFDAKLMIGEGGFGKVYKGMLRDGRKVAVKRSEPGLEQGQPEFHTEIMVLSKIRHNHLVSLIGYCDERDEMILVYEFMENGTLREHLYGGSGSRSRFSWEQRLQICIGAANGLYYLHTGGSTGTIIHRDVKSTNILLDENYVAKVADFGLSRSGHLDQTHVSTEVKGSFGYLDPEYFRCLQLTQKSDVYSFGVVLLEVLCARPVIDHLLPKEQLNLSDWGLSWIRKGELDKIVDPFLVGKINPNSLRKFGETVEKCLQENGGDRPSMVDVLWDLEYCLKLQHTSFPRQPYEDSTTEVSWGLPMPVIQRLPSNCIANGEDDEALDSFSYATSQGSPSEVFSLLNNDAAR